MIQHNFKKVGPHIWVSLWVLCVAVTVQCIMRNKQRFFTEEHKGGVGGRLLGSYLDYIHSFDISMQFFNKLVFMPCPLARWFSGRLSS